MCMYHQSKSISSSTLTLSGIFQESYSKSRASSKHSQLFLDPVLFAIHNPFVIPSTSSHLQNALQPGTDPKAALKSGLEIRYASGVTVSRLSIWWRILRRWVVFFVVRALHSIRSMSCTTLSHSSKSCARSSPSLSMAIIIGLLPVRQFPSQSHSVYFLSIAPCILLPSSSRNVTRRLSSPKSRYTFCLHSQWYVLFTRFPVSDLSTHPSRPSSLSHTGFEL